MNHDFSSSHIWRIWDFVLLCIILWIFSIESTNIFCKYLSKICLGCCLSFSRLCFHCWIFGCNLNQVIDILFNVFSKIRYIYKIYVIFVTLASFQKYYLVFSGCCSARFSVDPKSCHFAFTFNFHLASFLFFIGRRQEVCQWTKI